MPIAARLVQVAEEFIVRIKDQHITGLAHGLPVGIDAAVKRVELRVLGVRVCVNFCGLGVSGATDLLAIAISICQDDCPILVCCRADEFRRLPSFGPNLRGNPGTLLLHLVIHGFPDDLHELDLLHAEIHDLDAQTLCRRRRCLQHIGHELHTLHRNGFLHGTPTEFSHN